MGCHGAEIDMAEYLAITYEKLNKNERNDNKNAVKRQCLNLFDKFGTIFADILLVYIHSDILSGGGALRVPILVLQ